MTSWRKIQRENLRHWESLFQFLEIPSSLVTEIIPNPKFPLNIPLRLAKKIQKNDLNDPILKQFLPSKLESIEVQGFTSNPVKDDTFKIEKKLLQKYQGRALLVCTSACAMNCRFCFRKDFDYETDEKIFANEIAAIREDDTLSEIILSGGDPLSLSNQDLKNLIQNLSGIPHVKRLRFHTRFPIGIPERIDEAFLEILQNTSLQVFFVIHTNISSELDDEVLIALRKIQKLGIPVLSQTVLLQGINDHEETLQALFQRMIDNGIIPYYLHQLDRAKGTAHFEVSDERGKELIRYLQRKLPGYGVPRYAKEIAGEPCKQVLA